MPALAATRKTTVLVVNTIPSSKTVESLAMTSGPTVTATARSPMSTEGAGREICTAIIINAKPFEEQTCKRVKRTDYQIYQKAGGVIETSHLLHILALT